MGDEDDSTDDAVLGGRLTLRQPRRGHRFGHDAILLAAATEARAGEHAIELGAGVGAAGLALAQRVPGLTLTLIEIDETLCALARENARRNGLSDRVRVVALDIMQGGGFASAGFAAQCAQHVLMNPPFNDPRRQQGSPNAPRRLAHVASAETLSRWVFEAYYLLVPSGTLTLIWRADELNRVLAIMQEWRFGAIAVLPVYPRPGAAAIRSLVRGTRDNDSAPVVRFPGLTLNDADGRPSAEAEAILRGGAALRWELC
jgi:tRNA1(Val) A37 N6-methylase TrmN6